MLVAHRGFRSPKGENCMEDFIQALKTCSAVEFDIRLTKDKQLIIFHDHNFKRIGNTDKLVRDLTYNEILELDFFKENPRWMPPRFVEEFIFGIAYMYDFINVEIKAGNYKEEDYGIIYAALKILRDKTEAEIVVSSFSRNTLIWISKLDGELFKKGYLIETMSQMDKNLVKRFDYIHPYYGLVKRFKNVHFFTELNMKMNIWTFKENYQAIEVINLYPRELLNGFISDNPSLEINYGAKEI
ncbi:glycerophosphodiester phosphodiesterase [[Acholeplasma] multilocale]|uniref:glycerophosphodiester phosphodiesterase n=1 Tax=[Acholeplasma] multilocale TaxID=264638 RepID=UPI00047CED13|nr:glycerophosphodiester phosphodiesterase family protein [[Acholeplasma] multilocale]